MIRVVCHIWKPGKYIVIAETVSFIPMHTERRILVQRITDCFGKELWTIILQKAD